MGTRGMGVRRGGVGFLPMLVCFAVVAHAEDTDACAEMGFTDSLLCSNCDKLSEYVSDDELVGLCKKCCTEDSGGDDGKVLYAKAVLEVCK